MVFLVKLERRNENLMGNRYPNINLVPTELVRETEFLYCCECKEFLEENPYWDRSHTKWLHTNGIGHTKYIMYKLAKEAE